MQVSFVNGIYTSKGGTHVNYILDQITDKILSIVAKKKQPPLKPFQIKANLKLFISCLIENPSFDSQIKENLTTPYT
jgi:DNA topoisomerase-2